MSSKHAQIRYRKETRENEVWSDLIALKSAKGLKLSLLEVKLEGNNYIESHELMGLESVGVSCDFLDDLGLVQGLDCHYLISSE